MSEFDFSKKSTKILIGLVVVLAIYYLVFIVPDNMENDTAEAKAKAKKYEQKNNQQAKRLIPASNEQKEFIQIALKKGFTASHIYAIKSKNFKSVYFVGAKLKGYGLKGNEVGVWSITGTPKNPGMIMSVNIWAKDFSVVPDAKKSKFKITMWDDGAITVKTYVENIK